MERFGNISIKLDPKADMWFDKVKVMNDEFNQDKDNFITGKMSAMQKDRDAGRNID